MASLTFSDNGEAALLVLLTGSADSRLRKLVKSPNEIYVFGLFAMAAAAHQLQSELDGGKLILFGDDEAACATLTKEAANVDVALVPFYSLWSTAARRNLSIWTNRFPPKTSQGFTQFYSFFLFAVGGPRGPLQVPAARSKGLQPKK